MWPLPNPHSQLNALIESREQAQLISYSFENKSLQFQLFFEKSGLLDFYIPTDTVYARSVPADPNRAACRMRISDLERDLAIEGGRYQPPTSPSLLLEHARDRITLAYGRKVSDAKHVFFLRGEYMLLTCLVKDLADIQWTTE